MSGEYNVAVVGATGVVGQAMLEILHERAFPVKNVFAIASSESEGKRVSFGDKNLKVFDLAKFDFAEVDIALFSAGGSISEKHAPLAAAKGCVVIDNTSYFRNDDDIPLVIPEVNPEAIKDYKKRNIIANPNCSTIQMLVALKPIYDKVGIKTINVATYQSVSGAGKKAIEGLASETALRLNGQDITAKAFDKPIAFNVIPSIDTLQDNGYTREEMKMIWETQKIYNDKDIEVNPTCCRVPVFYGHAEAVHITTNSKITKKEAEELFKNAPGVELLADGEDYPTPIEEGAGTDWVYIGRLRENAHGLNMWVVADNVRKGAALNSVQIAELLLSEL